MPLPAPDVHALVQELQEKHGCPADQARALACMFHSVPECLPFIEKPSDRRNAFSPTWKGEYRVQLEISTPESSCFHFQHCKCWASRNPQHWHSHKPGTRLSYMTHIALQREPRRHTFVWTGDVVY
uniref:Uncharacterized protein n=1 Tax=Dunaliella tertiolecta TaxID=3047 RepID=A0A7S3QMH6_DUNTE